MVMANELNSGDLNTVLVGIQMVVSCPMIQCHFNTYMNKFNLVFKYSTKFNLVFRPPFEYRTSENRLVKFCYSGGFGM